ncbi:hypothetical protein KK083_22350 [Fulvivirgaceae bacterium PWU4]|uniref:Phage abortive infection protein n=1 Tax=Chryseosolibacter histidini TaxID=2782349 RepID=A0AAP2DNI6_9BACT|nr:hypothetical protein [Chryseosolibacter histidini]MBT1699645.1 hypothetical protein [Chryseosolibacter histidini]
METRKEFAFLIAAGTILLLPALLTQTEFSIFDFSNSGEVGDTIGGVTAPFVGLLGAFLVYKAFLVQVESNKIQLKNSEFQIALKLIDDLEIKLSAKNRRYEFSVSEGESQKIEAANFYEVIRFWNGIKTYREYYRGAIVQSIRQVNFFKKFVMRSKNLSITDKSLLMEKAGLAFGSDLSDAFYAMLMTQNSGLNGEEKQFYDYCRKFNDTTLQDLLYHTIDIEEFNT